MQNVTEKCFVCVRVCVYVWVCVSPRAQWFQCPSLMRSKRPYTPHHTHAGLEKILIFLFLFHKMDVLLFLKSIFKKAKRKTLHFQIVSFSRYIQPIVYRYESICYRVHFNDN